MTSINDCMDSLWRITMVTYILGMHLQRSSFLPKQSCQTTIHPSCQDGMFDHQLHWSACFFHFWQQLHLLEHKLFFSKRILQNFIKVWNKIYHNGIRKNILHHYLLCENARKCMHGFLNFLNYMAFLISRTSKKVHNLSTIFKDPILLLGCFVNFFSSSLTTSLSFCNFCPLYNMTLYITPNIYAYFSCYQTLVRKV